ncbi:hypothetical protein NEPAR04_2417 [Nematocida parisii]|nr:hypothetical protein NEPAR08_2414 [Nematocida parisii]KAI5131282.1 hypothetical protein NEPAR03_2375 [Nematocida parisii]KAI5145343.1 hypothetical protein NEPAR04_2417 [Nematocida parisii]
MKASNKAKIERSPVILFILSMWLGLNPLKTLNIVICTSNKEFLSHITDISSNINEYCPAQNFISNSELSNDNNNYIEDMEDLYNTYICTESHANNPPVELDQIEMPAPETFNPQTINIYSSNTSCVQNSVQLLNPFINQNGYLYDTPLIDDLIETFTPQEFNTNTIDPYFSTAPHVETPLNYNASACNDVASNSTMTMKYEQPTTSMNKMLFNATQYLEINKENPSINIVQKSADEINKRNQNSIKDPVLKYSNEYKNIIDTLCIYRLSVAKQAHQEPPSFVKSQVNIKIYSKLIDSIKNAIKERKIVWSGLYMIKKENISTKLELIDFIGNNRDYMDKMFKQCNMGYSGMSSNLYKYLTKNYSSCYIKKKKVKLDRKLVRFNPNEVTLGDIYIKKDINLLWHTESLWVSCIIQHIQKSTHVDTEELQKDLDLKRKLLLILSIPEIYEDLFYMQYDEINLVKQKIASKSFNDIVKEMCDQFYIIEYLYGEVHTQKKIIEESYKKIQEDKKKSLYQYSDIYVYNLVYKIFICFYRYSLYLYNPNTSSCISNAHHPVQGNLSYFAMKNYTKFSRDNLTTYQGKGVIIKTPFVKCKFLFEYTKKAISSNKKILDDISNLDIIYSYRDKDGAVLSYSHHYHIQLIDNSAHRVHIMHFPFFMLDSNGTKEYHYIHTIDDIANHVRKTFHTKTRYGRPLVNNVYPFKYNRKDKTWSMIGFINNDRKKRKLADSIGSEINKTIGEMDKLGFDVIFYYIQENIKINDFVLAQFNPISKETINTAYEEDEVEAKKLFDGYVPNDSVPRIPLFLPKFITLAVHIGPYILNKENCLIQQLTTDYQNLVPIEFSSWLDYMVKKEDRKQTIIELATMYKRELNYYSDFYILGINSLYEDCDCYAMNIKQKTYELNKMKISWYVKKQYDLGEYTNYELDLDRVSFRKRTNCELRSTKFHIIFSFLNMLQRKHASQDMLRYGICIYTRKSTGKSNIVPLLCSRMKILMDELFGKYNGMYDMLSPASKRNIEFIKTHQDINTSEISDISKIHICIKNVNYTKSKLGIHYNILNTFF